MEITQRSVGEVTIITLSGDIQGDRDSHHLASELSRATNLVVLNLAQVRSIDGSGFGMIQSAYHLENPHVIAAGLRSPQKEEDELVYDLLIRVLGANRTLEEAVTYLQQR